MTFLYVGFQTDLGFSGGLLVDTARRPLADCAREIDRAVAAGDRPPFRPIADEIPPALLSTVLLDPSNATVTGYDPDQMAALKSMISGRVPGPGLALITRKVLKSDAPLIDWVNYLSCGDREARIQALRAVPLHTGPLLTDPEFRELVDKRAPLTPLIAQKGNLNPTQMRRYAQIETRFAEILARSLEGQAPLSRDPLATSQGISTPVIRMGSDGLRHLAMRAARILRADQIPSTPAEMVDMLTYVSESDRIRRDLSLGEGPFRRHLSRVSPAAAEEGVWGAACGHLQAQLPIQETADYLRSLSTVLVTGVLISRIRTRPEVDFDRLGAAARVLREKGSPDQADGALLGAYVQRLSNEEYRLTKARNQMIALIGEGHSLKSLREAQVRWHHVRQTYQNEVMTGRDPLTWTPLIGEADLDGIRAVELTSSAALDRQGTLERHCVGGYTGTVMGATSSGASLIFSLERGEEILSTIEMTVTQSPWDPKSLQWKITQNKAARNAEPVPEAIAAGKRLLEVLGDLPKKQIRGYLSGIQSNVTQVRDTLALTTTRYGGDVVNPDLPERVMTAYEEVLPKTLKGLGPDALLGELSRLMGEEAGKLFDGVTDRVIKALPAEEPEREGPEESGLQMAS